MPTAVREAVVAAIATRLTALLAGVVVERARRAAVNVDAEPLPRVVVTAGAVEPDDTQEPGNTHYTIEFEAAAYVSALSATLLEQGLSDMHARIVAALVPWYPTTVGLGQVTEGGAEFIAYPAKDSKRIAGEVVARFTILAITPTGSPYL